MPWVRKPDTPDSFDLSQAFHALVTGEPAWDWVTKWSFLVGLVRWDTVTFCNAGPPAVAEPRNFPNLPGPLQAAAQAVVATDWGKYIGQLMHQRVFYAYCTSTDPSTSGAIWHEVCRTPVSGGSAHTVQLVCSCLDSNGTNYRIHEHYDAGNGTWVNNQLKLNGSTVQDFGSGPVEQALDNYHTAAGPFDRWDWYIDDRNGNSTVVGYIAVEKFGVPPAGDSPPPAPPDAPAGANPQLDPPPSTVETIGQEVQRIEWKLDAIMSLMRWTTQTEFAPSVQPGTVSESGPDAQINLDGALGVVVLVDTVPPEADLDFGTPPRYWHLARITLSTADGYLEPIDVPTSPFVIRPLPAGVTGAIATTWTGGAIRLMALEPIT